MAYKTVFVVSGDPAVRDSLAELVASVGLGAETFESLEVWIEAASPQPRGCLVLDARTCNTTSPERLSRLTAICARLPVLLLVDRGDVPTAVRAIKEGAADVFEKPLREGGLLRRIQMAVAAGQDAKVIAPYDQP